MPPVNPYNKYIKQYQASNVNTATPEKLMIMLFDGALQFLQKAKTVIEVKDAPASAPVNNNAIAQASEAAPFKWSIGF